MHIVRRSTPINISTNVIVAFWILFCLCKISHYERREQRLEIILTEFSDGETVGYLREELAKSNAVNGRRYYWTNASSQLSNRGDLIEPNSRETTGSRRPVGENSWCL